MNTTGCILIITIVYFYVYFSPFLLSLLSDHDDSDEPLHITLADFDFDAAMALMNLIYVGK